MNFRLSKNQPNKARQEIKSKNFASKLFIVVEGKETEIIYFNAFISYYADNLLKEFILLDKIDYNTPRKLDQKIVANKIE